MGHQIQKLIALLLGVLLSATIIPGISVATVASATTDPASGVADFSRLQKCMSSPEASLNIVYIMDNSASMGGKVNNDPENARGPMMKSTLRIFQQLADEAERPVSYLMVPFGDSDTEKIAQEQVWLPLTKTNLDEQAINLSRQALQEDAGGTDWRSGLSVAKTKIEQRIADDANSCFVAIWLTDGQIDLNFGKESGYTKKTGDAFREICESDDLINWFRDPENEVAMLAALLNAPPKNVDIKPEDVTFEKSKVLFESVVTGTARNIPQDVADMFKLSLNEDGSYRCGDVHEKTQLGSLVVDRDAAALSWKFIDLVASLSELKLQAESKDSTVAFVVPEWIGKIRVYLKGNPQKKLIILDDQRVDVCLLPKVCTLTSNSKDTGFAVWDVNIPATGTKAGDWSLKELPKNSESKVFVGLNGNLKFMKLVPNFISSQESLNLEEGKELDEGQEVEATFKLLDAEGDVVSDFGQVRICLREPKPVEPNVDPNVGCEDGSKADFKFTLALDNKSVSAEAKVKLEGVSDEFTIPYNQPITVKVNNSFAKISCGPICVLKSIPNNELPSVTKLPISKDHTGDSVIEVTGFEAFDNDPMRAQGYKILSPIVSIAAGQPGTIEVSLLNTEVKSEEDDIQGIIHYKVTSGGKSIPASVPVTFSINQNKDWKRILSGYLLALLIAVGLPYLALLLQARRSAVFIDDEFKYIAVPVMVSKTGELLSKMDSTIEESLSSEVPDSENPNAGYEPFVAPNFKGLSGIIQIPKGAKSIQFERATLSVEAPRFDAFAPIKVSLSVPDSLVYSFVGKSANQLQKFESTADQSLSDLMFLYASISVIEPTDSKTFVEKEDADDFSVSDGSSMSFETNRAVSDEAFQGTLVIVIPGMQREPAVLSKTATSLRSQSFEKFNADLLALREQELVIEQELATKALAASQASAITTSGNNADSNTSHLAQNDDFDDFDDFGASNFSGNTNNNSSDDDDF